MDRSKWHRLARVGTALAGLRKWSAAGPILRECLALRENAAPDVWSTFDTGARLCAALLGRKWSADAEPLLVAGCEGMRQREKTIPP